MSDKSKRIADDRRMRTKFYAARKLALAKEGVEAPDPCSVCGWPAKQKVGEAWYCNGCVRTDASGAVHVAVPMRAR